MTSFKLVMIGLTNNKKFFFSCGNRGTRQRITSEGRCRHPEMLLIIATLRILKNYPWPPWIYSWLLFRYYLESKYNNVLSQRMVMNASYDSFALEHSLRKDINKWGKSLLLNPEQLLTPQYIASQKVQAHFKNHAANATRFSKCVWSFLDIMHQRINSFLCRGKNGTEVGHRTKE